MTALATSAQPGSSAANPRPVPWTRLIWVTWRQHRAALAGVAALLGGLALYLLVTGLKIRGAYAGVTACRPARSLSCQAVTASFDDGYHATAQTIAGLLQVVPVLVGVFAGAPLLARELETGTFRFAWTQGCGRTRWVTVKLILLAATLAGAAYAFSLLFSWYYQPFFAERADGELAPQLFDLRGVDFAAWTLVAFALGAFAGVLVRRTVPAIAASLAAWTGLDLVTALFLRKHYQPPLTGRSSSATGASGSHVPWVVSQWWTGPGGHQASQGTIRALAQSAPSSVQNAKVDTALTQWLGRRGYTQWMSYQPESRFWHFQLIEGGWLLALALLLATATVLLVRDRAA